MAPGLAWTHADPAVRSPTGRPRPGTGCFTHLPWPVSPSQSSLSLQTRYGLESLPLGLLLGAQPGHF